MATKIGLIVFSIVIMGVGAYFFRDARTRENREQAALGIMFIVAAVIAVIWVLVDPKYSFKP